MNSTLLKSFYPLSHSINYEQKSNILLSRPRPNFKSKAIKVIDWVLSQAHYYFIYFNLRGSEFVKSTYFCPKGLQV